MTGVEHTWGEPDDERDDDGADAPMGPVAGSLFIVCSQVVVLGLLFVAVADGLCLGPGCEPRNETRAGVATLLAFVVLVGGPALVARACRDWRWAMVPIVELAALVVLGVALG